MEFREKERFEKVIDNIQEWAIERGIDKKGTIEGQRQKTLEEIEELRQAINTNNHDEIIDAIGDIFVTLVVGRMLYKPDDVTIDIISMVYHQKIEYEDVRKNILLLPDDLTLRIVFLNWAIDLLKKIELNPYVVMEINSIINNIFYFCDIYNLELIDCIESAYNEIKDRKGKMIDGTFVKEK